MKDNMASKLLTWTQRVAILDGIELAYRDLGLEAPNPITINDVHLIVGDDCPKTPIAFAYSDDICAIAGEIGAHGEILQLRATQAEWTEHTQQEPYINSDLAYEVYKDESVV